MKHLKDERAILMEVLFQLGEKFSEFEKQQNKIMMQKQAEELAEEYLLVKQRQTEKFLLIQKARLRTGEMFLHFAFPYGKPLKLTTVFAGDLGTVSLEIMCRKGVNCECAKSTSSCDLSFNTIGATDGFLGAAALLESRLNELEAYACFLKGDLIDIKLRSRRNLIQVSQCPGIGKTTMLGLIAKEYSRLLAESQESGQATDRGAIACLVTYNGDRTSNVLSSITVEEGLCLRVLYGALACHPAQTGHKCEHLLSFNEVAKKIPSAALDCPFDVTNTRLVLWRWFGRRPIFVGIDEALKCKDGIENDKLQSLMTAAGTFLDTTVDDERVSVVISSLSPDKFMNATIASSRAIKDIPVFPLERKYAVEALRKLTESLLPSVNVSDMVFAQVEAITGGHARAIEEAAKFMISSPSISNCLSSWQDARDCFIKLAEVLGTSSAKLASRPNPDVFECLISSPPVVYRRQSRLQIAADKFVSFDELIYTGQVLVANGLPLKITVAPWAFLSVLMNTDAIFPSTLLLQRACKLSFDQNHISSWFEGFCIFFVAEALRRGGETLKAVVPHLHGSFDVVPNIISIEDVAEGSAAWLERFKRPLKGKCTDEERKLAQAKMVKDRVNEVQCTCAGGGGGKCVVLVMPPMFTALDAIVVTQDKVVGIQIKSQIDDNNLIKKVSSVRSWLQRWQDAGCALLGSDGLILFMVGVDVAPAGLQLIEDENIVTAGQLRQHFLDVFFRYGLTGGESK